MTDDLMLFARDVVIRYHAHGFRTRADDDGLFVWREAGWEGPFDASALHARQDSEIARIEGDARVAAVVALAREVDRLRRDPILAQYPRMYLDRLDHPLHDERYQQYLLKRAGWDDARATLYGGIAASLHERGELLRETLD